MLGTPWALKPWEDLGFSPSVAPAPWLTLWGLDGCDRRGWPFQLCPQEWDGGCRERRSPLTVLTPHRKQALAAVALAWAPGFTRQAARPHGCGTDLFGSFAAD